MCRSAVTVRRLAELKGDRSNSAATNLPHDGIHLDLSLPISMSIWRVGIKVNHDAIEVQSIQGYHEWWLEMLARRHRLRPMVPDRRLGALGPIDCLAPD